MSEKKYIPHYGDLDRMRYEPLLRTKSRAYQMVCWQGFLGTHEFFLSRSLRGWGYLLFSTATLGSFIWSWELGILLVVINAGITWASIKMVATSSPNHEIYSGTCEPIFQGIHMLSQRSILWNINFWQNQEPTDPPPPDL